EAGVAILLGGDPLLDHRGLDVELHVRRDRGADERHEQVEVAELQPRMRSDRLAQHLAPIRLGEESGADVGQEGQGEEEEDLLHPAVGAAGDQQPDENGGGRHGDVAADPEQLRRRGDADELGDDDPQVGDQQGQQDEGRLAQGEGLAHQVRKPLAGDGSHAGAHLLDDADADGDHHHGPQQAIAVGGAGRGIGGDAAGVVAGTGGQQPGPEGQQIRPEALAHQAKFRPPRRCQISGSNTASASSTVTMPSRCRSSSSTGTARRLYSARTWAALSAGSSGATVGRSSSITSVTGVAGSLRMSVRRRTRPRRMPGSSRATTYTASSGSGTSSSERMRVRASPTVVFSRTRTKSVVMMRPALSSSYSSRAWTSAASSGSMRARSCSATSSSRSSRASAAAPGAISSRMSAARSWSMPSSRSATRSSLTSSRVSAAVSSSRAATISALSR